ncbi:MAG: carboxypeptidase-like regulatory domain-containing protein [Gemmatimonadaceae bacterium]|nr:carboxypeptidase-like regulatory domain-containing protein [Gemmatimonadaceae bacterium]
MSARPLSRALVVLAAGLWPLVRPLAAQSTATVRGTVRAQSGRPLGGAAVTDGRDTVRSADDGRFTLRVAVATPVTIEARSPGFLPARVPVPALAAGASRAVAIVLVPLATLDVQRVVAARTRPLLNAADAGTGGAIERVELQTLPTNAREPLQLLATVPGIAQATGFFGDAPRLTFNGRASSSRSRRWGASRRS